MGKTFEGDEAQLQEAFKQLTKAERRLGEKGERVYVRNLNSPKRILEEMARIAQDPSEPGKTRAAALKEVFRLSGFPVPKQLDSYEALTDEELRKLFEATFEDAIRATKSAYWLVLDEDGTEHRIDCRSKGFKDAAKVLQR